MTINNHADAFEGRKVVQYGLKTRLTDPSGTAYVLRTDWDDADDVFDQLWNRLLRDPRRGELEALIFGRWTEEMYEESTASLVSRVVDAASEFKGLKALFFPDITYQENEISWIVQSDVSPILEAYPNLEVLRLRGGNDLAFGRAVRHANLKKLIIETGGLAAATVRQLCALNLPNLTHLELWLGAENYGGNCTTEELAPILSGKLFPNLEFLGLMDSEIANDIAQSLAGAPVLDTIKTLNVSMGTMTDEGANHLLSNPKLTGLNKLDVSDNFLSDAVSARFGRMGNAFFGAQKESDREWRYCSVAE